MSTLALQSDAHYDSGMIVPFTLAAMLVSGVRAGSMPGRSHTGPLPPMTDQEKDVSAKVRTHVQMLGETIGERNVFKPAALNQAVDYISGELTSMGLEVQTQTYAADDVQVQNLWTTVKGHGREEEIVVVGAHYDSVRGAPGANDNGTGVAAVIEIARMLKDSRPARTVRLVFFVNEEPPFFHTDLMGSVVYARACKARGDRIVAMLTPETIGCYSDERHSQRYPPPFNLFYPSEGNFIGFVGDASARSLVKKCVGSFRKHTMFPCEGVALPDFITGVGWSDHWSFSREGYPALMITDTAPFRYEHYHTPDDTPDKIDYDRTARVVAGIGRVVKELANPE